MRRPRVPKPHRPPAPRIDAASDRAEQLLFDEAFSEPLWRRAVPR